MPSHDPVYMCSVCNNQLHHAYILDTASKCVLSKLDALNITELGTCVQCDLSCTLGQT